MQFYTFFETKNLCHIDRLTIVHTVHQCFFKPVIYVLIQENKPLFNVTPI